MGPSPVNPLGAFLAEQTILILDGGLATTLEDRGFDLDDDLWSARVLLTDPGTIEGVHGDFLTAGADCVTTATYQASLPGLEKKGLSSRQAVQQLLSAVDLAVSAREDFWSKPENRTGRIRPLVAASVGPYGAFLADGSEYAGNYGLEPENLDRFHRPRWEILAQSPADLLACETLPCLTEAAVLLELLNEYPGRWAWFSFSCRDGASLSDGTPFAEAVALCDGSPQVAAIGINCTAPEFISPLLEIGKRVTEKPLIVYPNSGEVFDPLTRSWGPGPGNDRWLELVPGWIQRGARAIGGCCRIGPADIATLRRGLLD